MEGQRRIVEMNLDALLILQRALELAMVSTDEPIQVEEYGIMLYHITGTINRMDVDRQQMIDRELDGKEI